MTDDLEAFKRERDAALLSLDRHKIRRYARKYGVSLPSSEETFWRAVHKARTGAKTLPPEARRESKEWLRKRGSSSMDDGDV